MLSVLKKFLSLTLTWSESSRVQQRYTCAMIGRSWVTRKVVCVHVVAVFQIVHALFHFQILIGENKKNKKIMWGKWVFPTSQDPLHHPLNYGCRLFPVKKGLVDLEDFSSFVKRRRDRRFQKIPINREWNPKLLIWQNSIEGKVDCWYEN